MSKIAVENVFGSLSSYTVETQPYTSSALGLGPLMIQTNGATELDDWAGPLPVGILRPVEYSTSIPAVYPWAMQWSSTLDWVFLIDNAAAAVNRRLLMATYNRSNGAFNIQGFVTMTYPTATAHTIRGFRMTYDTHISGTVSIPSGSTNLTGSGTNWLADRACTGNRIGFGSTDPTQISTWYELGTITSNTVATLTAPAATLISASVYVIEDLRAVTVTTNATVANGGVYVTKGLRPEAFIPSGTTIAAATTIDSARAVYWLADAASVTNSASFGCGIEPKTNYLSQSLYVFENLGNPILYKYNLKKPLFLTTGKDTGSLWIRTGFGGVPTGTPSQANNGRLATTQHGPGSGSSCLYFTTTTKVYRTADVSTIINASTTWIADNMTEIPPGGANTFAASSLMNSIEFAGSIDKFLITVNATTTPFRSYITQYRTDSGQFDRVFGVDTRQVDQSAADSSITPIPSMVGGPYSVWAEKGVIYIATIGTTAITNRVYALPLGADWEYASSTGARVITPSISTPNANKYVRLYVNAVGSLGGGTGKNLGLSSEDYRAYYRTSGITDNSGGWTLLNHTGNLSGIAGAAAIQFMFEFRTIGLTCIPDRILSCTVLYEDLTTDSHYQPSVSNSSITNKRFAWRFANAFGSTVPTLQVRLYDAVSGGVLVTDTTASPSGSFEKSTNDGVGWGAYNTTDKANETTYIRYTPASLGDNIKVRAVLTQT